MRSEATVTIQRPINEVSEVATERVADWSLEAWPTRGGFSIGFHGSTFRVVRTCALESRGFWILVPSAGLGPTKK